MSSSSTELLYGDPDLLPGDPDLLPGDPDLRVGEPDLDPNGLLVPSLELRPSPGGVRLSRLRWLAAVTRDDSLREN